MRGLRQELGQPRRGLRDRVLAQPGDGLKQPYDARLVSFGALEQPPHIALHPFGQIPLYKEGDLGLFKTEAIVLHIAEQYDGLLPSDASIHHERSGAGCRA